MAYIKPPADVKAIIEGGKILGEILDVISIMAKPGVSAKQLDDKAETLILAAGGIPAFKGYKPHSAASPFPSTVCSSVNAEIVHGFATAEKILKDGDIFTMDIGMVYKGCFTDTANTVIIGDASKEVKKLLQVTHESLERAIAVCHAGNTIADIGKAIEEYVNSQGKYGIIRDLCGHGVGHAVHEEPLVLNFFDKSLKKWVLEPGVVIAIEPMITLGSEDIKTLDDNWTIVSADGSLSAHYEHTIVITDGEPIVATRRKSEKK